MIIITATAEEIASLKAENARLQALLDVLALDEAGTKLYAAERAVVDAALRWHERSTRANTIELMVAVSRLREIRGEP